MMHYFQGKIVMVIHHAEKISFMVAEGIITIPETMVDKIREDQVNYARSKMFQMSKIIGVWPNTTERYTDGKFYKCDIYH